jgi:hypothetical protein
VLLEPLLFYVLHRVVARIQDPTEAAAFKLCVLDEAWHFIQHPTLRAYVQDGLKTWRKRNAAMILATQTADDFSSVDLFGARRARHERASRDYAATGSRILELAKNAQNLFIRQDPREQERLLKTLSIELDLRPRTPFSCLR